MPVMPLSGAAAGASFLPHEAARRARMKVKINVRRWCMVCVVFGRFFVRVQRYEENATTCVVVKTFCVFLASFVIRNAKT